jgi:formiminotetrahydrofolate cyclodeaminase
MTKPIDIAQSIGSFADMVAAGTPTPGGGSVAAYSGLLAASLGRMMCNLTIGKARYAEVEPRVREIEAAMTSLGERLRRLIRDDSESFEAVLAAYRLPKATDDEKELRRLQIESASRHATEVPAETARQATEVLRLLNELYKIGNANALSDVTLAAQLARVAIDGASYNVLVNLNSDTDSQAVENARKLVTELTAEASRTAAEIESAFLNTVEG